MTAIEARLKLEVWKKGLLPESDYFYQSEKVRIISAITYKILTGFLKTMPNNQQIPAEVDEALSLLFQDVKIPRRHEKH